MFDYKLTIDDLIIEYMVVKLQMGYEPSYTASEFVSFLHFFDERKKIKGVLYSEKNLFATFFKKKKYDWSYKMGTGSVYDKTVFVPHIEVTEDGLVLPTYHLNANDSVLYNKRYNISKEEIEEIRGIITEWLKTQSKRTVKASNEVQDKMEQAKLISALLVENIWHRYVENMIAFGIWPKQCTNIDKYLFEMNLAEVIGVESIKYELLYFYGDCVKAVASLLVDNKELIISNDPRNFLAYSNYMWIMEGYERLRNVYQNYPLDIKIDEHSFNENIYGRNKDMGVTSSGLNSVGANKLVRVLDKKYH